MGLFDWFRDVHWDKWAPTIVAFVGLPLTAIFALWREGRINNQKFTQEAIIRKETQERDDLLSHQSREREEAIRLGQQQREDSRRFMAERIQAYDELLRAGNKWWLKLSSLDGLEKAGTTGGEVYMDVQKTILEATNEVDSAYNRIMILSTNPVRSAANIYVGGFVDENKTLRQILDNRKALVETIREELRSQGVDAMFDLVARAGSI